MIVSSPGIYEVPEEDYHADRVLDPHLGRSLSGSGVKAILRSPARFAWERAHPVFKGAYDLGSTAHALALRSGAPIVRVQARDWRGKADQAERARIREAGQTPANWTEMRAALEMAKAMRRHPTAGPLLDGDVEQSLYWLDADTGVTCRGRVDVWRPDALVDVKTTQDASPAGFAKQWSNLRYDLPAAHYLDGAHTLTGEWLRFIWVCVEVEPPHLVAVYEFQREDLEAALRDVARARAIYAECESSGQWPGYPDGITPLTPPRWHRAGQDNSW